MEGTVHPVRRGDLVHHQRSPTGKRPTASQGSGIGGAQVGISAAIGPLETPEVTTNRVNVAQSFTIRILQPPNDTNRYSLEPSEVILELASNADPAPDLTSPAAIKVMVDPIDLPEGINETNINVRVSVPEDAILKNFNPKEVKVTRIIKPPTPPEEVKGKPDENPDEVEVPKETAD